MVVGDLGNMGDWMRCFKLGRWEVYLGNGRKMKRFREIGVMIEKWSGMG